MNRLHIPQTELALRGPGGEKKRYPYVYAYGYPYGCQAALETDIG